MVKVNSLTFFCCSSWPFFRRCCFRDELRPFVLCFGSNFSFELDTWGWNICKNIIAQKLLDQCFLPLHLPLNLTVAPTKCCVFVHGYPGLPRVGTCWLPFLIGPLASWHFHLFAQNYAVETHLMKSTYLISIIIILPLLCNFVLL